jgi:tetraacyldisaccharide 4'-kinase
MIISGQNRSAGAVLLRSLLAGASLPYTTAVMARNKMYDYGLLPCHAVSIPVISIGNITTGGTGKTPLVIWLCRYLCQKGLRVAVLTRGYKTSAVEMSDEPALLAKSCPGVQVFVNPDRVAGAKKAIDQFHCEALVMDDGFQHRRLSRDLNILAVDATCPFGYEKLLPAGLLREPVSAIERADAVIITRFDLATAEQIAQIETTIRNIAGQIPIALATHRLTHLIMPTGQMVPLETLKQKKIYVYCGIGNPQAFVNCLTECGITVVGMQFFNDHHVFTLPDIKTIADSAAQSGADIAVCTQKDWVKSAVFCRQIERFSFGSMAMELDFAANSDTIKTLVDQVIKKKLP